MIIRKAMLLGAVMALASTPAWALPGGEHTGHGNPHSSSGTPNDGSNPGSSRRSESGKSHAGGAESHGKGRGKADGKGSDQGSSGSGGGAGNDKSHKCLPHAVAYVASGTLLSDALTAGPGHSYSGEIVVEVSHGNRHAHGDRGSTQTYELQDAHLTLAVPDRDSDHSVGVDDLFAGDRVQVIGKVTELSKRCPVAGFTSQLTVRHVIFHGPHKGSQTTASTSTTTSTSSTSTTMSTTTTSTTTTAT